MKFSEILLHFGKVDAPAPPGRLGLIGVPISGGVGEPLWPQNAKSCPILVKWVPLRPRESPCPGVAKPCPGMDRPSPGVDSPYPGVDFPCPGMDFPCHERISPKDETKRCPQRMCLKDIAKGCAQRMSPKDIPEGYPPAWTRPPTRTGSRIKQFVSPRSPIISCSNRKTITWR